jgi:hypothetical protein
VWLQADLVAWAKVTDGGSAADRDVATQLLSNWQVDPDLARLREPNELDKLSVDERQECRALWNNVDAVLVPGLPTKLRRLGNR